MATLLNPSYYTTELNNYRNVQYAVTTLMMQYFTDILFKGESGRVIYSSTDFAFRQRSKKTTDNNLDLPFMNVKISGISKDTERQWANHMATAQGTYVEELQRKLRTLPVQIQYDSTIFYQTNLDTAFSFEELLWDDVLETILDFNMVIDNVEVKVIANVAFNLEFDPEYDRSDWLEKNKIHSIKVDFTVDTFFIKDNTDISIPKEILLQFNTLTSDGEEIESLEEIYDTMTLYFTDPE